MRLPHRHLLFLLLCILIFSNLHAEKTKAEDKVYTTEFYPVSHTTMVRMTGYIEPNDYSKSVNPFDSSIGEEELLVKFFETIGISFKNPNSSLAFDGTQLIVKQTQEAHFKILDAIRYFSPIQQVQLSLWRETIKNGEVTTTEPLTLLGLSGKPAEIRWGEMGNHLDITPDVEIARECTFMLNYTEYINDMQQWLHIKEVITIADGAVFEIAQIDRTQNEQSISDRWYLKYNLVDAEGKNISDYPSAEEKFGIQDHSEVQLIPLSRYLLIRMIGYVEGNYHITGDPFSDDYNSIKPASVQVSSLLEKHFSTVLELENNEFKARINRDMLLLQGKPAAIKTIETYIYEHFIKYDTKQVRIQTELDKLMGATDWVIEQINLSGMLSIITLSETKVINDQYPAALTLRMTPHVDREEVIYIKHDISKRDENSKELSISNETAYSHNEALKIFHWQTPNDQLQVSITPTLIDTYGQSGQRYDPFDQNTLITDFYLVDRVFLFLLNNFSNHDDNTSGPFADPSTETELFAEKGEEGAIVGKFTKAGVDFSDPETNLVFDSTQLIITQTLENHKIISNFMNANNPRKTKQTKLHLRLESDQETYPMEYSLQGLPYKPYKFSYGNKVIEATTHVEQDGHAYTRHTIHLDKTISEKPIVAEYALLPDKDYVTVTQIPATSDTPALTIKARVEVEKY